MGSASDGAHGGKEGGSATARGGFRDKDARRGGFQSTCKTTTHVAAMEGRSDHGCNRKHEAELIACNDNEFHLQGFVANRRGTGSTGETDSSSPLRVTTGVFCEAATSHVARRGGSLIRAAAGWQAAQQHRGGSLIVEGSASRPRSGSTIRDNNSSDVAQTGSGKCDHRQAMASLAKQGTTARKSHTGLGVVVGLVVGVAVKCSHKRLTKGELP
ncbi:hypothetical protein NL676_034637 [Syzygium grande]|nr:hypothetical protein NL676_034637 [Syzygium grande]